MRFGVHVSVSGGPRRILQRALARGCETVQLFSSNPRGWALSAGGPHDDAELRRALEAKDIRPVVLHAPYLVNVASPDRELYAKSVASLVHAAERARRLGAAVIVHAGRDASGPREQALQRVAAAVRAVLQLVPQARVLVELTAGGRGAVAALPREGAELLEAIGDERAGLCLDTCHAHAAGCDLSTPRGARAWLDEVEAAVGWERVPVLHANDTRDPAGSGRDRHWHVGRGRIGERGFRALLADPRLREVAVILETPGGLAEDLENLARARALARGGPAGRRRARPQPFPLTGAGCPP